MGTRKTNRFNPRRQVAAFERLVAQGLITDLEVHPNRRKTVYEWQFRLTELELDGEQLPQPINLDFTKYQLLVTHTQRQEPRVFIDKPNLPFRCKHTWYQEDGRLCLYKPSLWQWRKGMQFDRHLFTDIVMWIYHYEVWRETGIWYGEEAKHDRKVNVNWQRLLLA